MGFFSGLMKGLTGGSDSEQVSTSGFSLLPQQLQQAFNQYGTKLTDFFQNQGTAQPNADQNAAFTKARQGVAATPQSLQSDLAMLMNPYDESVVNQINRQAQGDNSLVNQYATQAGQQGSNRSFLGSSDVEQNRLNNIGQFRQSQYNNAINQILGPLANARQGDIGNLLNIGQTQQQLPYQNLQMFGQLLGAIPQSGGSAGNSNSSSVGGLSSFF